MTGTIDPLLSAHTPTVTMNLAGPVFNDIGAYAPEATTAITTSYSRGRDLTYGVVNMRTAQDEDVGWEGLLQMNCMYSNLSGYTPGHIGWGEYKFTVEMDGVDKSFYLSTLDGNWLSSALGSENKIVFYIDFRKASVNDPIAIDIQVWQYSIQDWRSVGEDERVTFWELHDAERARDKIVALSNQPFVVGVADQTEVPFVNDRHVFDINVLLERRINVPTGKTVVITDFESRVNNTVSYHNSIWMCEVGSGIRVNDGDLLTYSHDPLINNQTLRRWAVQFLPNRIIQGPSARGRWGGIESNGEATLNIRDALITHATSGISVGGGEVLVRRSLLDSCHFGIQIYEGDVTAERDTIQRCWIGIHVAGSGFSNPDDRITIDSCQVVNSSSHGVLLGLKYPSASATPFSTIKPEESVLIRRSEIKHNGMHGVASTVSMAAIRDCNISRNGWLWGTLFSNLSPDYRGYSGIYAIESSLHHIHGSDFQSNVGDGIYTSTSTLYAHAQETEYDAGDVRGWNCFDGNRISIFCDKASSVFFGKYMTSNYYVQDRSALRNPRWKNPADQRYINVHVKNANSAEFDHNYWLPSTNTLLVEGTIPFTAQYPVLHPDSVRCGDGPSPGGNTLEIPGSHTSGTLVRLVKNDSLNAAWELIKTTISDSLSVHDARVYTWALQTLRLTASVDSAQLLLENEAFNLDAGGVSSLDMHALLNLRGIYMLIGNIEAAWRTYDTLNARLLSGDSVETSRDVEMYRARILWYLEKDSSAAAGLISDLYSDYPTDINVSTLYVDITGDTTAVWYGAFDEMEKLGGTDFSEDHPTDIAVLGCYPNPFNPSTTISFKIEHEAMITLRIYSVDGRLVDIRRMGMRRPGRQSYVYIAQDLPSGNYLCDLTDGKTSTSFMLILNK